MELHTAGIGGVICCSNGSILCGSPDAVKMLRERERERWFVICVGKSEVG